ncbi:class I SAM-dependent methyltransferase [Actinomyces slackii]|nr:class I SAM-dependent methyltransferase [Actinomyces slackii]
MEPAMSPALPKAPAHSQFSRPSSSLIGRLLLTAMNQGHQPLHAWGLKRLVLRPSDRVLDVGCGGGAAIKRILRETRREVAGVDHSPAAVDTALRANRAAAASGRLRVVEASVEDLPFRDGFFDAVTAFETTYFWPDIAAGMAEIRRVLPPGGRLLIANEYATRSDAGHWADRLEMTIPDGDHLAGMARQVGFSQVDWDHHPRRSWLRLVAIA